jgi:hypothetical protein
MSYNNGSELARPVHWVVRKTDVLCDYKYFSVLTGPTIVTGAQYDKVTIDSLLYRADTYSFFYRLPDLQVLQDSKGTTSANYGTSQYTAGYAPVPTAGRILRVGSTRTYTKVWDAYAASQHGDDIIIDAGTYDCDEFSGAGLTKCVRFWGATENPADVVLRRSTADDFTYGIHFFIWYPYYMGNVPDGSFGCGIFHLTLDVRNVPNSWDSLFDISNSSGTDSNTWIPPDTVVSNAMMFSCNT